MRHVLVLCAVALVLVGLFTSCSRDEGLHMMDAMSTVMVGSVNGVPGSYCTTLFAGQDIDAGTVCAEVIDSGETEQLCITYNTTNGWELMETHTWVGEDLADMPQNRKGNPQIGLFPYNSGDISGATTYQVCIDLNQYGIEGGAVDLCGLLLYAAAHAALGKDSDGDGIYDQTETGWGDGDRMVDRGNWATYFTIELSCENGGGSGEETGETAFAYNCDDLTRTCFIDFDEDGDGVGDFNRWGWTNGALGAGTYYFDIYAGAGQCDITKGTLVGLLTVDYDGSTAVVTYETCGTYYMDEVHLYVGNEPLARDVNGDYTVAPGQYPYIDDDIATNSYTFTVPATGDIYVVAHAVVVGDYSQGDCGTRGCVSPVCNQTYLYATENDAPVADGQTELAVKIWKINATAGTATLVSSIPAPINDDTGNFNGNAWDEGTNRFYFTEFGAFQTPTHQGPTELYFNDLAGNQTYAGNLSGGVSCGAFYQGKYYYFPDRMDDFYEVTFNPDGTIATNVKIADVLGSTASYNQGHWIAFGDIAISEDGVVYGSATDFGGTLPNYTSVFFKMNLNGTGYQNITTGGVFGAGSYQVAFGSDGALYGLNAKTPYDLITIDLTDGSTTFVANLPVAFSDAASGPCLFE